jgi:hypothetical protein
MIRSVLEMTTVILRINNNRKGGLRGTVELPGVGTRVFQSDEELLDLLYEWAGSDRESGKGSGSTPSSAMRVT